METIAGDFTSFPEINLSRNPQFGSPESGVLQGNTQNPKS